PALLDG
ncbi:hypothetical protein MKD33_03870, partial [Chromobacterium piscinae]